MRVHDITVAADFTSDDLKRISLTAGRFHSDIILKVREATIDVKSLLGMMLFPIKKGTVVTIQTKGKDEEDALEFMCQNMEG
jgi:phosphocarrier protein HPr